MDSLIDAVERNEDDVAYFKQQNPSRVIKPNNIKELFRDNEGWGHIVRFDAKIEVMGKVYYVDFPINIDIYTKEGDDVFTIDVEAQNWKCITIRDENRRQLHVDHNQAMQDAGITYPMIDEWATKYCLKG
jgi:hypothetical protein